MPDRYRQVDRILVVRLDNVGDVIMLTPALRALRRCYSTARITLMVSRAGAQVAPMIPWIDDIMESRVIWQDASFEMPFDPSRESALVDAIRAERFDAQFIFTSFSQSPYPPAYAGYLAGIPVRVGQSKEFGGSVLSQWIKSPADHLHQVDRNLYLLEAAGVAPAGNQMELQVPLQDQRRGDELLRAVGVHPSDPFVVLAPGASCAARRYDPVRFAQAAELLAHETGLPIVTVGSERERGPFAPILARPELAAHSLLGSTSLSELAGVIRRAALLICNNSGPMHIADALGTPIVVTYSGTELESQWRPRFAPASLLRRPTDCSPCYAFTCPFNMECLDIPPEKLVKSALEHVGLVQAAGR